MGGPNSVSGGLEPFRLLETREKRKFDQSKASFAPHGGRSCWPALASGHEQKSLAKATQRIRRVPLASANVTQTRQHQPGQTIELVCLLTSGRLEPFCRFCTGVLAVCVHVAETNERCCGAQQYAEKHLHFRPASSTHVLAHLSRQLRD